MEIATVIVGKKSDDQIFVDSFKKMVGSPVLDTTQLGETMREILTEKGF